MDAGDLTPLALIIVAALFGYIATIVVRRAEVLRAIALDIDAELRAALNESLRDDEPIDILNAVNEHLIRARMHTVSLPPRTRDVVEGQLRVAHDVTMHLFSASGRPAATPQPHLQAAISGAREVIAPLLLPPPFLYRRAGKPRSYPTPREFARIMRRHDRPEDALGEALGRYLEGLPEGLEDHYGF